jgi:ribonuclease HII
VSSRPAPTLRVERALLRSGVRLLAGVDEVGRGALAGPVSVGVVVITASSTAAPSGVRDSKLLTPVAREALVPQIQSWAHASSVGHADAGEIDERGIIAALRLAAERALDGLPEQPDAVLLDGSHDWLTRPAVQPDLFTAPEPDRTSTPVVHLRVKADLTCSAVAAASILAKVERDAIMRELGLRIPDYGWVHNVGYAAPDHLSALERLGPSAWHRRSWRLPGVVHSD